MTNYAAFLRGIGPTNPNMRNEKLRELFMSLGFANVQTVISSGNVLFESAAKNIPALEKKIEKAIAENLGFKSAVFLRSAQELEQIIKKEPFKKLPNEEDDAYLIVTFLKKAPWEIFTVVDFTKGRTPDFMRDIEKKYGKEVTTRTWKTVGRIVHKFKTPIHKQNPAK